MSDHAYPQPNPVSVDRSYRRWRALQRDLDRHFDECWHSSTAQRFTSERRRGEYCAGTAWKIARSSGRYRDYPAFSHAAENPITSGGSGAETMLLVLGALTAVGAIGYALYKVSQPAVPAPLPEGGVEGPTTPVTAVTSLPSVTPNAALTPPPAPALASPTHVLATAGDGRATVTWTATSPAPETYTVISTPDGQTRTVHGSTQAVVLGLTNGKSYTFTVMATDAHGNPSAPSAPSNAVTPMHVTTWQPLSLNANQGFTFTLGPTYRLSFPTSLGKSFQTLAQGLLNQGFTMVMAYDQGAILPSDWPSSDSEVARFRYAVAVDASSHSTVEIAAVDIPAGLRVFQLS